MSKGLPVSTQENRSTLRSLRIFEVFRDVHQPLTLSELSALAGEPISTSHGVVRALQKAGYIYSPAGREFYPTRRLLDMAGEIDQYNPVTAVVTPALSRLRDSLGETVLLGTRQGDETMFLLALAGSHSIRYSARIGDRRPLHASSIGKALLGQLSPDELSAWLAKKKLPRVTVRTVHSAASLRRDLAAGRRRGYYVTRGESVLDVMAIAMPVVIGGAAYGVSVAGPLNRVRKSEKRIAEELAACIHGLQRRSTA